MDLIEELDELSGNLVRDIQKVVAISHNCSVPELIKKRPIVRLQSAKMMVTYIAHVECEITMGRIAKIINMDRTTMRHHVERIEDMRECPDTDDLIDRIVQVVQNFVSYNTLRFFIINNHDEIISRRIGFKEQTL